MKLYVWPSTPHKLMTEHRPSRLRPRALGGPRRNLAVLEVATLSCALASAIDTLEKARHRAHRRSCATSSSLTPGQLSDKPHGVPGRGPHTCPPHGSSTAIVSARAATTRRGSSTATARPSTRPAPSRLVVPMWPMTPGSPDASAPAAASAASVHEHEQPGRTNRRRNMDQRAGWEHGLLVMWFVAARPRELPPASPMDGTPACCARRIGVGGSSPGGTSTSRTAAPSPTDVNFLMPVSRGCSRLTGKCPKRYRRPGVLMPPCRRAHGGRFPRTHR